MLTIAPKAQERPPVRGIASAKLEFFRIIRDRHLLPATTFVFVFLILTLFYNVLFTDYQHFTHLADAPLRGRLSFPNPIPWGIFADTVLFNGAYYWPLAPFPAVLLVPFVALFRLFRAFFYQGYLQFVLNVGVFWFSYWLARRFRYTTRDALFLAGAFCFASVYQFVAFLPASWYFTQVVAVLLLFLAIAEHLTRRRYWLIGLLLALAFMTRFTAGLGILFFMAHVVTERSSSRGQKLRFFTQLLIPVAIAGLLLLGYNYARFNNPFENGYMITNNHSLSAEDRFELLNYGLFKLENVPTNLYYYFIKTVDPVVLEQQTAQGNTYVLQPPYLKVGYPGVGFFVVSPIFLYLFRARWKDRTVRLSLLPIGVVLVLLLLYFWPGWVQTGPRYMLDFLPFAYLVLLTAFRDSSLSRFARGLIVVSALFNLYLLQTLGYPPS